MWDLCAMLPDEGALISRGEVRKSPFNRAAHDYEFSVKLHNLTLLQNTPISDLLYLTFISDLSFPPITHSWCDKNEKDTSSQRTPSHQRTTKARLPGMLQFLFVTGILTVVGSRVASLVVLEFCLRAVSGWVTAGPVNKLCDKHMPDYITQIACCFHCSVSLT